MTRAISVIIPSLNSRAFIGDAVESALRQDPSPSEIIVQDGGSTDGTLNLLERFGDAVDVLSEPDDGQADALNRAIRRASGDVIVWLNADDLLAPKAFAAASMTFAQHPDADFVFGDFDLVDADGAVIRQFRSSPYDPDRVFVHGCYIFSGAIFFRRELLDRVGEFDRNLHACMDFDYLLRIGKARAAHVGTTVAQFRITPGQKSNAIRPRFIRESHALRWRTANGSRRLQLLTIALDVRDSARLLTNRIRYTKAWSGLRGQKQL